MRARQRYTTPILVISLFVFATRVARATATLAALLLCVSAR